MTNTKQFSVTIDMPQPYLYEPMVREIRELARKHGGTALVNKSVAEKLVWKDGILSMISGKEIVMTRLHRAIFAILADCPNEQLSYEEIVSRLEAQGFTINSPSHFRVLLHRLRKRIGGNSHIIQTERDNGYSLRLDGDTLTIR